MRIAFFSAKAYDRQSFEDVNQGLDSGSDPHELVFFEPRLTPTTAALAQGFGVVCAFINDDVSGPVLEQLAAGGTQLVALRSAGFNNIDLATAERLGIAIARVPAYSPHAVAEHTVGLMLTLNRKIHRAYNRVREGNFALDGLLGFDFHGKTIGIVGTGKIGVLTAKILHGFGCQLLAYDVHPSEDFLALGGRYVELPQLLGQSDVVSLHCPLLPQTKHLMNAEAIAQLKPGAMLVNTSRGALLDTAAVVMGLKSGKIGALALDVYEQEAALFFEDLSNEIIQDDLFERLLTFPNVLITGHQAFFTREALTNIAETTLGNVAAFERGERSGNEVGTC